jgi:hypothetical protein
MRDVLDEWPRLSAAERAKLQPFLVPPAGMGSWASRSAGRARSAVAGDKPACNSDPARSTSRLRSGRHGTGATSPTAMASPCPGHHDVPERDVHPLFHPANRVPRDVLAERAARHPAEWDPLRQLVAVAGLERDREVHVAAGAGVSVAQAPASRDRGEIAGAELRARSVRATAVPTT